MTSGDPSGRASRLAAGWEDAILGGSDGIERDSSWDWLVRMTEKARTFPFAALAAVLVLAALGRSGMAVWEFYRLYPFLVQSWDRPVDPFQSNLLPNAIGTASWLVTGELASAGWVALQVLLTLSAFVLIIVLYRQRLPRTQALVAVAAVAGSGIATVLWREMGRGDALTLVGLSLVVLTRRWPWAVVGMLVACLSAPEQALAAAAVLLVGSAILLKRPLVNRAAALLALALVVNLGVMTWFGRSEHLTATRIGGLISHAFGNEAPIASSVVAGRPYWDSFRENALSYLSAATSLTWSVWGGSLVLLVAAGLIRANSTRYWGTLAWLLVAPLLVGLFAGPDRTRDLVLVAAPLLLLMILSATERAITPFPTPTHIALVGVAVGVTVMTIMPSPYFFWSYEEPWKFLVQNVGGWTAGSWEGWNWSAR